MNGSGYWKFPNQDKIPPQILMFWLFAQIWSRGSGWEFFRSCSYFILRTQKKKNYKCLDFFFFKSLISLFLTMNFLFCLSLKFFLIKYRKKWNLSLDFNNISILVKKKKKQLTKCNINDLKKISCFLICCVQNFSVYELCFLLFYFFKENEDDNNDELIILMPCHHHYKLHYIYYYMKRGKGRRSLATVVCIIIKKNSFCPAFVLSSHAWSMTFGQVNDKIFVVST